MRNKHTKEKPLSYKILLVIRIILILIIIGCLIYIGNWYIENKKSAKMKELTESSIIDTISVQVPIIEEDGTESKTLEIIAYELDFDKLFSINSSTAGWISVPNTTINYPVAQATDNAFYLNHSFDKSWNSAGWIFADYRNKFDGTDKNIIIYGHNRMDSSMFATLKETQNPNWYNNQDNKYITYTTPDGVNVYEVFSVYTIKAESYYLQTDFASDASYLEFLKTLKLRSIHDFGVNLDEDDQIITLSTCDASGRSRVILHAKKIF